MLLSAALATCSSTPPIIPTKNLDRPTDMTFVCLSMPAGSDGLSGAPMTSCHNRGELDPPTVVNGQRVLGTFAFIPNASGALAVGDMDSGHLVELAPLTPGYGTLPIGGDPEAVAASQDGCLVAVASRDTCDFTLIDPARLLTGPFSQSNLPAVAVTGGDIQNSFRNVAVVTPSGRQILSTTGEVAFLPSPNLGGTCQTGTTARAVATFPGCDMVALLDFSFANGTATIVSAYYVRPDLPGGFQPAGAEPVCPSDCTTSTNLPEAGVTAPTGLDGAASSSAETDGDAADGDAADGGAAEGGAAEGGAAEGVAPAGGMASDGGVAPTHWLLQPLALVPDGSRVYVASLYDSAVTSLDIGATGLASPLRFPLAQSPAGVSRLRLNVDSYAPPSALPGNLQSQGQFLAGRGKFLYAFAADDSVRVIDIDATPVECDVNVVVDDLIDGTTPLPGCFPVGSARRRALARGPGLSVPVLTNPDSPTPLPRDLAFADLEPASGDANYQSLAGQFGFLSASNGQVYVVNLAPQSTEPTLYNEVTNTATHSFREQRDVGNPAKDVLTVSVAPQRIAVTSDQGYATAASFGQDGGPQLRFWIDQNGITNWFGYPDANFIISRTWDLTWEGILPQTARLTGVVQSAGALGAAAGVLSDAGADFPASGVQVGDVLMFAECSQNSDCQPDNLFSCQVAISGGPSICLPQNSNLAQALTNSCSRFMGSRMRYQVAQLSPTSLSLNLKLDEVPKTALNTCTVATEKRDCQVDIYHGAFHCVEVQSGDFRCVNPCTYSHKDEAAGDSQCRTGNVCEPVAVLTPAPLSQPGFCVEAPPLDASCFPQPTTSYSVRAAESYLVTGSSLPSVFTSPPNIELVHRIPLAAPQCPPSFLAQAAGAPAPLNLAPGLHNTSAFTLSADGGDNPCLYAEPANGNPALDGSPSPVTSNPITISAYFENPQLRFVLTNLQDYAGDLLDIHFEFEYGFLPLAVQIPSYEVQITMPVRLLTGPTVTPESPVHNSTPSPYSYPYIYVLDQGRSALTPDSLGQMLRINPREGSDELASFDTAISGSTPFQLQ